MENDTNSYLKTDHGIIINEKCIRWVKKMNECLHVCIRTSGCDLLAFDDTHKICKINSQQSYDKLNKHFE